MSDAPDGDDQDRSEGLDDDVLEDLEEYPPERPLGAEDYGTSAQEERVDEPAWERARRELPERERRADRGVPLLAGDTDLEGELAEEDDGPYDVDPDRTPLSAEEAAIH